MKKIFILTAVCLFAFTASYAQEIRKVKIEEVTDYIKNASHPLIVNFWATWCAPCVEEIPWFQQAVNDYTSTGAELVLVSLDFPKNYQEAIAKFADEKKLTATLFWLNETNADHFCPFVDSSWFGNIPVTLFINNKTGFRKFMDDQVKETELKKILDALVKE